MIGGSVGEFRRPSAAFRRGRRHDGDVGADVLGNEVCVSAEAIAGALDLDDHRVVQEPVEKRGGDDGIREYCRMPLISTLSCWR